MYRNLGIIIAINKCKSNVKKVQRGFMEGHPASMAGFVVSNVPLMIILENGIKGIKVKNKVHNIKFFSDDLKAFIGDLSEIDYIEKKIF